LDTFDFSRLGVLIVEDNGYVRQTLEDLLRHFQFGRIATAEARLTDGSGRLYAHGTSICLILKRKG